MQKRELGLGRAAMETALFEGGSGVAILRAVGLAALSEVMVLFRLGRLGGCGGLVNGGCDGLGGAGGETRSCVEGWRRAASFAIGGVSALLVAAGLAVGVRWVFREGAGRRFELEGEGHAEEQSESQDRGRAHLNLNCKSSHVKWRPQIQENNQIMEKLQEERKEPEEGRSSLQGQVVVLSREAAEFVPATTAPAQPPESPEPAETPPPDAGKRCIELVEETLLSHDDPPETCPVNPPNFAPHDPAGNSPIAEFSRASVIEERPEPEQPQPQPQPPTYYPHPAAHPPPPGPPPGLAPPPQNVLWQHLNKLRDSQSNINHQLKMLYSQPERWVYRQGGVPEPNNPPEVPSIPQPKPEAADGGMEKVIGFLNDFTVYLDKYPIVNNLKSLVTSRDQLMKELEQLTREHEQCHQEKGLLLQQLETEKYKMSVEMEAKQEFNWQLQQKIEMLTAELAREQSRKIEQKDTSTLQQQMQKRYALLSHQQMQNRQELAEFKKYHQRVLNQTISGKEEKVSELTRRLELLDELVEKLNDDQWKREERYALRAREVVAACEENGFKQAIVHMKPLLDIAEQPEQLGREIKGVGCQECDKYAKQLKQKEDQIESLNSYIKSSKGSGAGLGVGVGPVVGGAEETPGASLQAQWRAESKQLRSDTHSNVIKLESALKQLIGMVKEAGGDEMMGLAEETQHIYEQLVMFKIKPLFDRVKLYEQYMTEDQQTPAAAAPAATAGAASTGLASAAFSAGSAAESHFLQQMLENSGGENERLEGLLEEYNKKKENEKIIEQKLAGLSQQVKKLCAENDILVRQNASLEQALFEKRLQGAKFDDLRLEHQRLKTELAELKSNYELSEKIRAELEIKTQELEEAAAQQVGEVDELKARVRFQNNKIEALSFRAKPDTDEETRLQMQLRDVEIENQRLKRSLNFYYND